MSDLVTVKMERPCTCSSCLFSIVDEELENSYCLLTNKEIDYMKVATDEPEDNCPFKTKDEITI